MFRLKKLIIKLLTFWLPKKFRKNARNFLFWFTISDYVRFKNRNFHIISIGSNCLPRVLTTAIKLKPRKFYGEKSCPFDFYISDLKRTTELIQNDFSDFFENLVVNKNLFPHDYQLNNKQFKRRYEDRISNFLTLQQSDKMIYYIYTDYKKLPKVEDLENLYNILQQKRGEKPFKLIILTTKHLDLKNIIQIPKEFSIDNSRWVEFMINEYKIYDNKYTRYCREIGEELKKKTGI